MWSRRASSTIEISNVSRTSTVPLRKSKMARSVYTRLTQASPVSG